MVVAVGVGWALWRLQKRVPEAVLPDCGYSTSGCSACETYSPLSRLLAADDFVFLAAHFGSRPEMAGRLRRERRNVLRLYLRQLRADFRELHGICRALAARGEDPALAAAVSREALKFHRQMVILRVHFFLGWSGRVRADIMPLVKALDGLRQAMRASLLVATPQASPSAD